MKIITALLILLLSAPAMAQDKTPTLTEVETLKIQILNLQYELRAQQLNTAQLTGQYAACQATLLKDSSQLDKEVNKLKLDIEKNHQGFKFDIATGTFLPKEPVDKKK